jgi:hypothetical protein
MTARELSERINEAVIEEIRRGRRPGGILDYKERTAPTNYSTALQRWVETHRGKPTFVGLLIRFWDVRQTKNFIKEVKARSKQT